MILELSYRDMNTLSFADRFSYTQMLSSKQYGDITDFVCILLKNSGPEQVQ